MNPNIRPGETPIYHWVLLSYTSKYRNLVNGFSIQHERVNMDQVLGQAGIPMRSLPCNRLSPDSPIMHFHAPRIPLNRPAKTRDESATA